MTRNFNIKKPHLSRVVMAKALLFAACVVCVYLFMPRSQADKFQYQLNKTWNYDDIIAPFDVEIYYTPAEQKAKVDSATETITPVYYRNDAVADEVKAQVSSRLALDADKKHAILAHLHNIYTKGILELDARTSPSAKEVTMRNEYNVQSNVRVNNYYTAQEAYTEILNKFNSDPVSRNAIISDSLSSMLRPNIVFDELLYNDRVQSFESFYAAAIGKKMPGQTIVARGDIITPETYGLIDNYFKKLSAVNGDKPTQTTYFDFGKLMVIVISFVMLYTYLRVYRPKYYDDFRMVLFICLLMVVFIVIAFMMYRAFDHGLYMVPLAAIPIVMVVFLDARTAFFAYLITILLCAVLGHYMWDFVLMQFVAGFTALVSINDLSKRSQLLRAALLVFLAYTIVYTTSLLLESGNLSRANLRMYGAFAVNGILISFAYFIIFVSEKAFGFISRVTLVELSDINHPLLRELSEECPGTFQHSMAVSNLAASAAAKVGANTQLIRTGALYHDIGKMTNPAFFTENQHGVNPHDALSPLQSAKIVIGHVTEGLRKAEKAKLPEHIRRFIREHHGRGTARYFYTSYCNAHPDMEVDRTPFTYPGPNPQTVESSILMMADAVEAASRSLKEHTPEAITALVNKIIDTQVSEGLHNESPISFRDISVIKQSFASTLRTMYHSRISYPDAVKPKQS